MAASRRLLKPLTTAADSTQRVRRIVDALHDTASLTAATSASAPTTAKPKTINDMTGPPAWPVVGNFLLYIKKENRGRLHEAMVSRTLSLSINYLAVSGPGVDMLLPAFHDSLFECHFYKQDSFMV